MKRMDELTKVEEERVFEIKRNSLFINNLDSTGEHAFTPRYVDMLKKAGINAVNVTVSSERPGAFISAYKPGITEVVPLENDFRGAIREIYKWHGRLESVGYDRVCLIEHAQDIRKAKEDGKIGVIFNFQNGKPIEDDVNLLTIFYKLGIRIMCLTYNRRNSIGDGCGEKTDCGLSIFGGKVIEKMNELGMLIDLSHVGFRTSIEAIELSSQPVIASHSNVHALCNHFRNVNDDFIMAMADKEGVIGINFLSEVLHANGREEGSTLEHVLDHIDYVVKLVGVDHVGLGLDAAPDSRTEAELRQTERSSPEWGRRTLAKHYAIQTITEAPSILKGLVARGYSDQEIEKIIGGNWLRVFREVWKH